MARADGGLLSHRLPGARQEGGCPHLGAPQRRVGPAARGQPGRHGFGFGPRSEQMMIELEHVTKHYGHKVAVSDLNLRVERGELFAFLGPNGAGKTTTIKLMCGLLFPTTGRVLLGGFDMQHEGDRARPLLSYVPDQPYLYEKLTGREFLQFVADMYGMPASHGQAR